jgi:hypothetical protein
MADELHEVGIRRLAPTAWAVRRQETTGVIAGSICTCGSDLRSCAGCGQLRCLECEPYLSDDCRWSL